MPVTIDFGPVRLLSYSEGWQLTKPRIVQSGANAGKVIFHPISYHNRLSGALSSLLDWSLRNSDATSLRELRDEHDAFLLWLYREFRVEMEEPKRDG